MREYAELLRFAGELAHTARKLDGSVRIATPGLVMAAQAAGLARADAGRDGQDRPLFRPDLEPLLDRLFGPRPVAGEDWRLGALVLAVTWWLDGGDPAGLVSMDSLNGAVGELLGGTVAPRDVVEGAQRVWDLGGLVLGPGSGLTRREWADRADLLLALRGARGLAADAGVSAGEFEVFARSWAGEDGEQDGLLTPAVPGAAARGLREWAGGLRGVPAGEVGAVEVDAVARVTARFARERGRLPESAAELREFAWRELPLMGGEGGDPVLTLGGVLRLVDEVAGDREGLPRAGWPSLMVAAVVAALAREAAGPGGGDRLMVRAGLEPLLEELFGPRPDQEADWRLGALLWLAGLWLRVGEPLWAPSLVGAKAVASWLLGDLGNLAELGDLAGQGDLGGQSSVRGLVHLFGLVRRAGAGDWLTAEGFGDVVLAVRAACGDVGVGLTGLTVAGPGGVPDPGSDVARYLRVLTGGEGGPAADGQRPGLADLMLVVSGLLAMKGLAPGAGIPVGELSAFVRHWAEPDAGQRPLRPAALGAAAQGLREWAAARLGVSVAGVTGVEVDAAGRAAAAFLEVKGWWPESAEELGGFADEELLGAGVRVADRAEGAANVMVAYGRWLRFAAELGGELAGPRGVMTAAAPGVGVVVQVAALAREAAGGAVTPGQAGELGVPPSLGDVRGVLEGLFGQRPEEGVVDLRWGALLGLVSVVLRDRGEGGAVGQLTVAGLGGRVGQMLGQFGAEPKEAVVPGADTRMLPLLRMLGRELGRASRDSHAVMLAKATAEQARERSGGYGGRLSRVWVPDVGGGKLAPQSGERVAVRRVLTEAQYDLTHGSDRWAGALGPGEELPGAGLVAPARRRAGLRVPFLTDNPPFNPSGAFTARRFTVAAGDGRQVKVTEVTVTARFVSDPGMTGKDVELAKARLLDQVDVVANHQHVLPDGSQFHYRIVFTDDPDTAQQSPRLHPGDGLGPGQKITEADFWLDMPGPACAHEALHWLGLPDRYQDPTAVYRKQAVSPGVRNDGAVMSRASMWANGRHLELRPGVGHD